MTPEPADAPALSVVMPVYNEEQSVGDVLAEWTSALDALGITYEFLVLDDGSRDRTGEVVREMAARSKAIRVLRHENRGHGPTVLRGYREATGDWVLQIDSDGEIGAQGFADLWRRRESFDLLVGCRVNRSSNLIRQVVSLTSQIIVRVLYGPGIRDVNVPYRLIRRTILHEMVSPLPPDLFAPNVILSGLAIRRGLRIHEEPVAHVGRRHGRPSLGRFNVLLPAAVSLWQTVVQAWRHRSDRGGQAAPGRAGTRGAGPPHGPR